jgi:hypothetical protein
MDRVAVVCPPGAGDWFGDYVREAYTGSVEVEEQPLDEAAIARMMRLPPAPR